MIIRPQPGPQTSFLSCSADIAFYGGQAGGGKTWSLIVEPLRHYQVPGFTALTFRRSSVEIRSPGGLWDASHQLYSSFPSNDRPTPREQQLDWRFKSGATIKFAHLMNDTTVYQYQGTEIAYLAFDEITHFSKQQFFYLLTRNRSTCGVKPYVRATCNPDKDSWVRKFIDWWVDPDTGLAIPERSGAIRYFTRVDEEIIWADKAKDLRGHYSDKEWQHGARPRSFTFIPASIYDNQALLEKDPNYISSLKSQNKVEKERLLGGNWNISYGDIGSILNRNDFSRYDNTLKNHKEEVIYPRFKKTFMVADTASKTKEANDYSVVGVWGETFDGQYYILDWFRGKLEAPDLDQKIIDMWFKHKIILSLQGLWIEDASTGQATIQYLKKRGIPVFSLKPIKDKFLRLNDGLGTIKSRLVHVPIYAEWVEKFFEECECFRADGKHVLMDGEINPHDDQVDVISYAIGSQINLIAQIGIYKRPEDKRRKIPLIYAS